MSRPTVAEISMTVANSVSGLSSCSSRIRVGAVILNGDNRIIATGYNGAPSGYPHCDDVGCEFDEDGHCIYALHAEHNAILQCAILGTSCSDGHMYSTHLPCLKCSMVISQVGIKTVTYGVEYGNIQQILDFLHDQNISVYKEKLNVIR